MRLIATKPMRYATRRLMAGDEFEAPTAHGKILIGTHKARKADPRPVGKVDPPPAAVTRKVAEMYEAPEPAAEDDRVALRAEYQAKLGKRPFSGWSAEQLRAKIDEAE